MVAPGYSQTCSILSVFKMPCEVCPVSSHLNTYSLCWSSEMVFKVKYIVDVIENFKGLWIPAFEFSCIDIWMLE